MIAYQISFLGFHKNGNGLPIEHQVPLQGRIFRRKQAGQHHLERHHGAWRLRRLRPDHLKWQWM